jgi:hypothetical protein
LDQVRRDIVRALTDPQSDLPLKLDKLRWILPKSLEVKQQAIITRFGAALDAQVN